MYPPIVGNPRFFARTGPHPLGVVAMAAGCAVPVQELLLSGLASLEAAQPDQISFLGNPRQVAVLQQTHAGAVLVLPDMQDRVPAGTVALVTTDPVASWARVAALFHPMRCVKAGIHSSAIV